MHGIWPCKAKRKQDIILSGAHRKTSAKAALPTLGDPKVMQRTSEVGLCSAAQQAAMVAREPPTQNPVSSIRRGVRPPEQEHPAALM